MFGLILTALLFEPKQPKLDLEKPINITGVYYVEGIQGRNKYNGACIIREFKNGYIVNWVIGDANHFTGIGILKGNTFAVSWAYSKDTKTYRGINYYTLKGSTMKGYWLMIPGDGEINRETLTLLRRIDVHSD